MPSDTPGMRSDMAVRTHVEAQAAALMRDGGIQNATLYVNNTPCPGIMGCDQMLPHMLPEDAELTVYFKDQLHGINDWVVRSYTGLPRFKLAMAITIADDDIILLLSRLADLGCP